MNIVKTEILPEFEYFREEHEKDTVVLHHTVSRVGKYVDDWFKADRGKSKVAVAYVVDKDGTIFELFNPKYWAWHTGTGNRNNIDKRSIAVEIVNEGPLVKRGNDYFWFDGKYKYDGNIYTNVDKWRGFEFFAAYTEEQVKATEELLYNIWTKFCAVSFMFSNTLDYDEKYFSFRGIITHSNIRKDKTDLSPAFPLERINNISNILGEGKLRGDNLFLFNQKQKNNFIKDIQGV